jgi:ubiquinone biosynthesis protein
VAPEQLRAALAGFFPQDATPEEKIAAIEAALRSPLGQSMRETMARWIVDEIVPVERLVPEAYIKWRPPVRDSMMFVVARLSPARLAPKLLEQLELPEKTSAEERLLRLIAKVPGLQKLGQVIARNRHLRPALRNALVRLENGIRDASPADIRAIIHRELGEKILKYEVKLAPSLLSEASVSAVIRFTWRGPGGRRERGVFKVRKPHVPEFFAEDMDYLQKLAQYFGESRHRYGFPGHLIPDTFRKVRRLLQHEVNFAREQKTLLEAATLYSDIPGVRVPQLIAPLCANGITALSEEEGVKVTNAAARLTPQQRRNVAERILEALVAVPLLSARAEAVFHGDPHAGNLLYNRRTDELIVIDWALRERLDREQRRHLALLFLTASLRDPVGAAGEVLALSQPRIRTNSKRGQMIHNTVSEFLDQVPVKHLPSAVDTMQLLERVAMKGVKFPGALIMLSKVIFTLDGLLGDVGGDSSGMGFTIARHVAQHWLTHRGAFRSPLTARDWVTLQCSALLYPTRMGLKGGEAMLDWLLPARPEPELSPS